MQKSNWQRAGVHIAYIVHVYMHLHGAVEAKNESGFDHQKWGDVLTRNGMMYGYGTELKTEAILEGLLSVTPVALLICLDPCYKPCLHHLYLAATTSNIKPVVHH